MEDILAEWQTAGNLTWRRVTRHLVWFQAFCKGLTIMISMLKHRKRVSILVCELVNKSWHKPRYSDEVCLLWKPISFAYCMHCSYFLSKGLTRNKKVYVSRWSFSLSLWLMEFHLGHKASCFSWETWAFNRRRFPSKLVTTYTEESSTHTVCTLNSWALERSERH